MAKHNAMVILDIGHGLFHHEKLGQIYQRPVFNGIVEDEIVTDIADQCKKVLDRYVDRVWTTRSLNKPSGSSKLCSWDYLEKTYKNIMEPAAYNKVFKVGNTAWKRDINCRPFIANYYMEKLKIQHDKFVLVSIHTNGCGSHGADGFEVWYKNGSEDAKRLAETTHSKLAKYSKGPARGIHDAGQKYGILRLCNIPASIIAECAFHDGPKDNTRLHNIDYRKALGRAVAEGILLWLREE